MYRRRYSCQSKRLLVRVVVKLDGTDNHQKKYREKSSNYIAPGKHDLINWCLEAWKKVQTKRRLLQTGCLATYMTLDLDSAMAKFDNYEQLPVGEEDDFNRHDWKEEIKSMDKVDHYNLWISPLNWVEDLETKAKKRWI